MYKTFAGKYKSKVSKIARKYKQDGLFTVQYQGSKGRDFTTKVSQEEKTEVGENIDNSTVVYHANRTSLIDRLKAEKCEICGVTGKLDMHHVRKLKALDGKGYADKLMIARRGKTIALC